MDTSKYNDDNENGPAGTDETTEVLQFNLTNPDELSNQLEAANLNDDETDLLLSEALKLNAQLKEVLRNQQLEETRPSEGRAKSGKSKKDNFHHSHPLAEQFVHRNPRKTHLPPIAVSTDDRSKLRSGKTKKTTDVSVSQGGSTGLKRKGSAKKSKAVDNRPSWDDRFSYT